MNGQDKAADRIFAGVNDTSKHDVTSDVNQTESQT